MTLLTDSIREALLRNGRLRQRFRERGDGRARLSACREAVYAEPRIPHLALESSLTLRPRISPRPIRSRYGNARIGQRPLSEIEALRGGLGLRVERDLHFVRAKTIGTHADEAGALGYIRT